MKYIFVLFPIILLSCVEKSFQSGYLIFHISQLVDMKNSSIHDINSCSLESMVHFDLHVMRNSNLFYGYSKKDKLFVIYDLISNHAIKEINLDKQKLKTNKVVFSGFSEESNSIYYSINNIIYQHDIASNRIKRLFNINNLSTPFRSMILSDFYCDLKYNNLYLKFSVSDSAGSQKYSQKLIRVNIVSKSIFEITATDEWSIAIYKSYDFNQLFFSKNREDRSIFMVKNNTIHKLNLKNNTRYNFENIVMDIIDQTSFVYRMPKYNILREITSMPEQSKIIIFDHNLNEALETIRVSVDYAQNVQYFSEQSLFKYLIEKDSM